MIIEMRDSRMNQYRMIAMIPARLGSKRIPKKNLRYLGDKPLIQYPIDLALQIPEFESVWVNTESEELGKVIEAMGASFHRRPEELATDQATNREFTYHFMSQHECDYVIMLNSTSPLLRLETVRNFVNYINEHDYDTVLSTISEKAESFYQGEPLNFDIQHKVNSQMLEPVEKTIWALTAWKRETFMKLEQQGECPVFGGKLGTFAIPKDEACDLDTEEDWKIAESFLLARNRSFEAKYLELDYV